MAKKAPIDLEQVERLQKELQGLQQKMSKVGGSEGRSGAAILAEVAKLAAQIVEAGDTVVKDETEKKAQLEAQAKKLEALIKRMGAAKG